MSTEQKPSTQDPTQDSAPWATRKELEYRLLQAHCWMEAARNVSLMMGDTHTAGDINVLLSFLGQVLDRSETKEHKESLETVDATRVKVVKNWRSENDGPRYVIMDDDGRTGKLYDNNELVMMLVKLPNI